MAKNGKKKEEKELMGGLKTQTKHGILAVIFFVAALFFLMSYFNLAGKAGIFIRDIFVQLLGLGYILFPTLCILLGSSFLKSESPNVGWTRMVSGILFLLSSLGILEISLGNDAGILYVPAFFFHLFTLQSSWNW